MIAGFLDYVVDHRGMFYRYAVEAVKVEENMVRQLRKIARERETITILNPPHPRLLLEKAFVEFKKRYPDIEQRLVFKEHSSAAEGSNLSSESESSKTIAKLRAGSADIADISHIIGTPIPDDLEFLRVCTLRYFCIMAPGHPLAGCPSVPLKQLTGMEVHLAPGKTPDFLSELYQYCPGFTLHPVRNVSTQDIFTICGSGGVWISKAAFVKYLQPLVVIPLEVPENAEAGILYLKNHSAAVDKFVDVVRETADGPVFLNSELEI